jgi:hypothetical protein
MLKKIGIFGLFAVLIGSFGISQSAFAAPEIVFSDNFDTGLTGWTQTICDKNHDSQTCSLIQATEVHNPWNTEKASPPSAPYWGGVNLQATGLGSLSVPIEVRYEKTFSVTTEDDYQVSAVLGVTDCSQCVESTQLFIDGNVVFSKSGTDVSIGPQSPQTTFFESTTVHLTPGVHTVGINLYSTAAVSGDFRASFDDIVIQSELSCGTGTVQVGTECLPDTTDDDSDGIPNQFDGCPTDSNKGLPGVEGCGNSDTQPLVDQINSLLNRISELVALLLQYFPYTEAECNEFQATYDAKVAEGKKIPPKLEEKVADCNTLYE